MAKNDMELLDINLINTGAAENEKTLRDAVIELKNDANVSKIIREFKLNDEDILHYMPMLLDYRKDRAVCDRCPGLSACPKDNPGSVVGFVVDGGFLTRQTSLCDLYRRKLRVVRAYKYGDYDPELLDERMRANAYANERKLWANLIQAQKDPSKNWVYIDDEMTAAMKHIMAFTNSLAEEFGVSIAAIDHLRTLDVLKEEGTKEKKKFAEDMKTIKNVDILILNNFASEYKNDYIRDQIILPILTDRAVNKKMTILVSAYSLETACKMYAGRFSDGKEQAARMKKILLANVNEEVIFTPGVEDRF